MLDDDYEKVGDEDDEESFESRMNRMSLTNAVDPREVQVKNRKE